MNNQYEVIKLDITDYHGNNEFDISALHDFLKPSTIHIYAKDKHVGPIERDILTFKERRRYSYHSVQYKQIPKLITKYSVKGVINWLNNFPLAN